MFLKKILIAAAVTLGSLPLVDLPALAKTTYTGVDIKTGKGFNTKTVSVEGVVGNISVKNLDADQVIVEASGDDEYLKNLVIEEDGGNLKIGFKNDAVYPKKFFEKESQGSVTIRMPKTMPLDFSLNVGKATIDDRLGDTQLSILGTGTIQAQNVDGLLKSKVLGTGDIDIKNLLGNAICEINGTGKIRILDGKSDEFKASVMGTGLIQFGGEVKDATLDVMGPGQIQLAKVTGNTKQNTQGPGGITVNKPLSATPVA